MRRRFVAWACNGSRIALSDRRDLRLHEQMKDPTTVLYALSTVAQTCAALAALVGAIGLFRLQILREQRKQEDQTRRLYVSRSGVLLVSGRPLLALVLFQAPPTR
jgi:hypothetical protein